MNGYKWKWIALWVDCVLFRKPRVVLFGLINEPFTMINEETNFRRTVRVKSHNTDVEDNNFVSPVCDVNYDQLRKKSLGTEDTDIYDIFTKVRVRSLFGILLSNVA